MRGRAGGAALLRFALALGFQHRLFELIRTRRVDIRRFDPTAALLKLGRGALQIELRLFLVFSAQIDRCAPR